MSRPAPAGRGPPHEGYAAVMPKVARSVLRWAFSNLTWWLFWLCGAAVVTAVLGALANLEGWSQAVFVVGIFGVTLSSLVAGSKVAVRLLPDRVLRTEASQQPGFGAGLLDLAATEQQRKLRAAMQRIAGEIAYGRKMIQDAQARGEYWDRDFREIPNQAWVEHSQLLAEAAEALEAYQAAEDAYHEFDRINHRLAAVPKDYHGVIRPREEDRLGDAIEVAVTAEKKLREAAKKIG